MALAEKERTRRVLSLALAAVGPASVAVAHFAQSILLLHHLSPGSFGAFGFLIILAALSWNVWTALFCAPLAHLVNKAEAGARDGVEKVAGSANLYGAVAVGLIFAGLGTALGIGIEAALVFGGFAALSLVRWFGRAHAYLHGHQLRSFASDVTYSALLIALVGGLWAADRLSLTLAFASMGVATLIAIAPFGALFAKVLTGGLTKRPIRSYATLARTQAPWSLLSVISIELTANSHAYIVTLWAGTAAYAPIAATALLVRPMTVASSALRDVERPRFARLAAGRRFTEILRSVKLVRAALALVWIATAAAVLLLFATDPYVLFPPTYSREVLLVGSVLWVVVSGLAMLRVPEAALLQAVGRFRPLAFANVLAAAVSVAAVTALMLLAGPVWSIAGIFAGQAVSAIQIAALSRAWRREHRRAGA